ncbi:hypothetical protein BD289DRAFT_427508 [Coniella lustricola]|uniref:Hypersensitive response-inducing protein n=1 Tax=Coniella lustricola TaxID=2025994 RepID=A0A2T3AFD8_9PEZI|nr:hypothetical protein BD289DRAFT_427508 [Coniella lustricola]
MQFSTAVVALASAMTVSADVIFQVSNFTAACIPHSSECSYDFVVIQPGTMETTGVECTDMRVSDGTLPAVADGTCAESSRTWTVTKPLTGGLVLTVSQPVTPSSNTSGTYTIPVTDLVLTQTGASIQQSYDGPTSFALSS